MLVPTINDVPVLLPPHDHPDFGKSGLHYHVDFRYYEGEPKQDMVFFTEEAPVYKEMKQVRQVYQAMVENVDIMVHLGKKYPKSNCVTCPHKGLPLMRVSDSVVQCVGHSLCFDNNGNSITDFDLMVLDCRLKYIVGQTKYFFEVKIDGVVDSVKVLSGNTLVSKIGKGGPWQLFVGDIFKLTVG